MVSFQLKDLAADAHGNLLREVAASDGRRNIRNVANLGCQVAT